MHVLAVLVVVMFFYHSPPTISTISVPVESCEALAAQVKATQEDKDEVKDVEVRCLITTVTEGSKT
jgi:hypothetical protein